MSKASHVSITARQPHFATRRANGCTARAGSPMRAWGSFGAVSGSELRGTHGAVLSIHSVAQSIPSTIPPEMPPNPITPEPPAHPIESPPSENPVPVQEPPRVKPPVARH